MLTHRPLRLGPLENNSFIIVDPAAREAAVVDVGFEPEAVIDAVRAAGLTVRWLLGTHAHYDHVAGMRTVQEALGGDYRLHPADRPLLEWLGQQAAAFGLPPAEPPAVVHDLADGERVPLGGETIEVIHTPGHSPGGVCFRWNDWLWVGDTLFAGSIGRTDLPGGSFEELERSIRTRLYPLGDDLQAFTGHGPFTTIGRERLTNPFVGEGARLA
ncbi:MAG: MBL fold metallo-hydrolase [Candidatus Eisenbacteria bacterium]|uniref:MBL fold metallo-hydrolase n=1 Tax=Eiseniibacteriota bacterium TaxID=2212470 RepID=A0A9D6LB34_UNCEI|nr:MBL fold metallo-hydrolase [Candidatus Eisenbacteria bacterium]MBI3539913.1 MBL fold metallo-hydrolase [Candidatus Eisenbacteria bacterium]